MNENISWVEAKSSDAKIAGLVTKLAKTTKGIETGGCGCGCGCGPADKSKMSVGVKQS